jgi:hypothetical protein
LIGAAGVYLRLLAVAGKLWQRLGRMKLLLHRVTNVQDSGTLGKHRRVVLCVVSRWADHSGRHVRRAAACSGRRRVDWLQYHAEHLPGWHRRPNFSAGISGQTNSNLLVNLAGGTIGNGFTARDGAVVNVSSGSIGSYDRTSD